MIDSVCFASSADTKAAGRGADFGQNPQDVVTMGAGNFSGLYPPLIYLTMRLLDGPTIGTSVLVMKLANRLSCVDMENVLFGLLHAHRRPIVLWSTALFIVALGMLIVPSTI